MNDDKLIKLAQESKEKAYVPYSHFRVGAAIITDHGTVYTGANIENASFGATNCAERSAVFKAVLEGERKIEAVAIASDSDDFIYPCGICRQVLAEFGTDKMRILCSNSKGEHREHTLGELLPGAFREF